MANVDNREVPVEEDTREIPVEDNSSLPPDKKKDLSSGLKINFNNPLQYFDAERHSILKAATNEDKPLTAIFARGMVKLGLNFRSFMDKRTGDDSTTMKLQENLNSIEKQHPIVLNGVVKKGLGMAMEQVPAIGGGALLAAGTALAVSFLPEELAALPVMAGIRFWQAQMMGESYRDLRSQGVDHKKADIISTIVGAFGGRLTGGGTAHAMGTAAKEWAAKEVGDISISTPTWKELMESKNVWGAAKKVAEGIGGAVKGAAETIVIGASPAKKQVIPEESLTKLGQFLYKDYTGIKKHMMDLSTRTLTGMAGMNAGSTIAAMGTVVGKYIDHKTTLGEFSSELAESTKRMFDPSTFLPSVFLSAIGMAHEKILKPRIPDVIELENKYRQENPSDKAGQQMFSIVLKRAQLDKMSSDIKTNEQGEKYTVNEKGIAHKLNDDELVGLRDKALHLTDQIEKHTDELVRIGDETVKDMPVVDTPVESGVKDGEVKQGDVKEPVVTKPVSSPKEGDVKTEKSQFDIKDEKNLPKRVQERINTLRKALLKHEMFWKQNTQKIKDMELASKVNEKLAREQEKGLSKEKIAVIKMKNEESARLTKEKLMEADEQLKENVRQAREDMIQAVKDYVPTEHHGKFIAAITKVLAEPPSVFRPNDKTFRNAEKVIKAIERRGNEYVRKKYVAKVEDLIKSETKRLKAITGKAKGNIDATYNDELKAYLSDLTSLSTKKEDVLKKTQEYLDRNPEAAIPESILQDLLKLEKTNVKDMTTEQLQEVMDDISDIKHLGKTKFKLKKEQLDRKIEKQASDVVDSIKKTMEEKNIKELTPEEKSLQIKNELDKLLDKGVSYLDSIIQPERILKAFTNFKDSPLKRYIFDALQKAENAKTKSAEIMMDKVKAIHKDIGNTKKVITKVTLNGKDYPITIDQGMGIYAYSKSDTGMLHLKGTLSDSTVIKILDSLPEKNKKMVDDTMKDVLKNIGDRVSTEFRSEHGISMPMIDDYFPIKSLDILTPEAKVIDQAINGYASVRKGFTITRKDSDVAFKKFEYVNTLLGHISDSEHYIAYNTPIKMANKLIRNKDVSAAMRNISDNKYHEVIDFIDFVANGKIGNAENVKFINQLRLNVMASYIGLSPTVALKSFATLSVGLKDVQSKYSVSAAKMAVLHPFETNKFIDESSQFMKTKESNRFREIQEINESVMQSGHIEKNLRQKFRDVIMAPNAIADKSIANLVWYGKYLEGVDKGSTHEQSVQAADELVRNSQPLGGLLSLPSSYRGGTLKKTLSTFTSAANQDFNNFYQMAKTWNEKTTARQAKELMANIVIPGLVVTLANVLTASSVKSILEGDDPTVVAAAKGDEDAQKEFAIEFTNNAIGNIVQGMPALNLILNPAIDYASNMAREYFDLDKKPVFVNAPIPFNVLSDINQALRSQDEDVMVQKMTEISARTAGLPVNFIKTMIEVYNGSTQ